MCAVTRRDLLSPLIAFPALWLFGVLLSQIDLLPIQRPWSGRMWLVVFLVPAIFVCAGVVAQEIVRARVLARRSRRTRPLLPLLSLRPLLLLFVLVGYAELVHQFAGAGTVPLFSSDIDEARFAQPGGITIVLTDLLTVAGVVAIVTPPRLLSRKAAFELSVAALCLFGFAMQAGRGSIVLVITVGVLGRILVWGFPRFEALLAGGALVVFVLSAVFYARTSQHSDNPFETSFYGSVLPGVPWLLRPLVPVYVALVTNFEVLARIVDYFPAFGSFGYWRYDVGALDRVLPALEVTAIGSTQASPFVTATMVAPYWADGGYVGVAIGTAAVAMLTTAAFAYARLTGELRWSLVAAYLLYLSLFGVYANLFTAYPDWLIVTPLLFLVGTLALVSAPERGGAARAAPRPASP